MASENQEQATLNYFFHVNQSGSSEVLFFKTTTTDPQLIELIDGIPPVSDVTGSSYLSRLYLRIHAITLEPKAPLEIEKHFHVDPTDQVSFEWGFGIRKCEKNEEELCLNMGKYKALVIPATLKNGHPFVKFSDCPRTYALHFLDIFKKLQPDEYSLYMNELEKK